MKRMMMAVAAALALNLVAGCDPVVVKDDTTSNSDKKSDGSTDDAGPVDDADSDGPDDEPADESDGTDDTSGGGDDSASGASCATMKCGDDSVCLEKKDGSDARCFETCTEPGGTGECPDGFDCLTYNQDEGKSACFPNDESQTGDSGSGGSGSGGSGSGDSGAANSCTGADDSKDLGDTYETCGRYGCAANNECIGKNGCQQCLQVCKDAAGTVACQPVDGQDTACVLNIPAGGGKPAVTVCVIPCQAGDTCPAGTRCTAYTNGDGELYCLPE